MFVSQAWMACKLPIAFLLYALAQNYIAPAPSGKTYGSLQLGSEMMNAIAYMDMKGSTCLYPFLRCAMWLGLDAFVLEPNLS